LGRWKNFLSSKTRQLGGFSYFFSFITISKSSPNASAICRISFSEKLSRFIFCERFCEIFPDALLFFGYGKKKKTAGKAALCL
jgi:hypothetical protein